MLARPRWRAVLLWGSSMRTRQLLHLLLPMRLLLRRLGNGKAPWGGGKAP